MSGVGFLYSGVSMQDFKHDLISVGDEYDYLMVSTFFGTTLPGNWDEDRPFPVLQPLWVFQMDDRWLT